MPADGVLTPGEWEALLFQCPEQVRPLVLRLAVHHGAVERASPEGCPLCGQHGNGQGQAVLDYGRMETENPAMASLICTSRAVRKTSLAFTNSSTRLRRFCSSTTLVEIQSVAIASRAYQRQRSETGTGKGEGRAPGSSGALGRVRRRTRPSSSEHQALPP
jgi:hypothetical protein